MSIEQDQRSLDSKRASRVTADRKTSQLRSKQAQKQTELARASKLLASSKNPATIKSKMQLIQRLTTEIAQLDKQIADSLKRSADYMKQEASLQKKIAEQTKKQTAEQKKIVDRTVRQAAEQARATREIQRQVSVVSVELEQTGAAVRAVEEKLANPTQEPLRILFLGSSSQGDLRIGREIHEIKKRLQASRHRDQIQLEVREAATREDLLQGITLFEPHVLHFSGHGNEFALYFEDDLDELHEEVELDFSYFQAVVNAVDNPPLLVVLNSCESQRQVELLAETVAFAIGTPMEVDDASAITYAERFYESVANGQSLKGAHNLARADLKMNGVSDEELPIMATSQDPATSFLVRSVQ